MIHILTSCHLCQSIEIFSLEDNLNNNFIVSSVSPGQQLKYMREDTAKVAMGMLHKISQLIGPKQCAICADACIVEMFDSLTQRMENNSLSFCDKNHFIWTQHHYGLMVLAVEVRWATLSLSQLTLLLS
jgi:hypothetical protein